ncbi:hypothetical protein [Mycobacterium intracellulare]|uniref:hypothetical protein n=1 Tax=Mycobacterium intracellulare TaxID=1767 RepID=UPI001EED3709|nr:hypothetical protein [Mycobacterium intracellulare]MEE3755287.1 hypothetical protein [Mycobacterium intracellulare]
MGTKRPWKVHYHHDGTKAFTDDETMPGGYTIDTTRPIDGTSSHADEATAHAAARQVSRHGGQARIILRDSSTGTNTLIRAYAPYEAAMDDVIEGKYDAQ